MAQPRPLHPLGGPRLDAPLLHPLPHRLRRVSLDDLKNFRQWGSKTPGHPEYHDTPGVETTTGPLGQGFGNGVGMALAERWLAERFNKPGFRIVDHYTYALCSDGDLMEGVSAEAASIAGFLKLGKLIYFYDDNTITIDGHTDLAFSEDVGKRFEAYGWHVQHVADVNDLDALREAIETAKADTDKPSLIIVKTIIGYGSPNKKNTSEAHGSPLGKDEVVLTKQNLGWPWDEPFYVPDEALQYCRQAVVRGAEEQHKWKELMDRYKTAVPRREAASTSCFMSGGLPEGWDDDLPTFAPEKGPMATRTSSGQVINAIAQEGPQPHQRCRRPLSLHRRLHQGRRRHQRRRTSWPATSTTAYASTAWARSCRASPFTKGMIAFGSTFLIFYDYMRPPLRLAAIMSNPLLMVYTHDSIGLGEDGPTHQPVEMLVGHARRCPICGRCAPPTPTKAIYAWKVALQRRDGPTCLIMTRQKLPIFNRTK